MGIALSLSLKMTPNLYLFIFIEYLNEYKLKCSIVDTIYFNTFEAL